MNLYLYIKTYLDIIIFKKKNDSKLIIFFNSFN